MGTNVNDKFLDIGSRGTLTTLAAPGKEIGASSVPLTSPTGWPSGKYVAFSIRRVQLTGADAGKEEQGTYTEWVGTLNGNSIDNIELQEGVDQDYPPGSQSQVMIHISVTWGKRLISGLRVAHTDDGKLKEAAVKEALGISGTVPPDWNQTGLIPTFVSNNGQKESVVNVPADVTNLIQAGTKVRIPRTGTTPTQSAAFVSALSHYASKTSPVGMTNTNLITAEAWIWLDSYAVPPSGSGGSSVISRYQGGAGGQILRIMPNGTLNLFAGTGGAQREVTSYQSIPLGRWIHIAATLDSANNIGKAFIDGAEVPSCTNGSATAFVQAGDLRIGMYDTTSQFNGKIANARLWSVIRTPQQIRDNHSITLTTATGLVANFPLNSSWNDMSGNNNHLSSVNGAINTFSSNPFKAIEYGIITNVGAFSGGNTPITVYTGNSNTIPNETLGQLSYSTARTPFGFPSDKTNWQVQMYFYSQFGMGLGTNQWGAMIDGAGVAPARLTVPIGKWDLSYEGDLFINRSANSTGWYTSSLSTSTTTATDIRFNKGGVHSSNVANILQKTPVYSKNDVSIATQTNYYLVVWSELGGATVGFYESPNGCGKVIAECAYI